MLLTEKLGCKASADYSEQLESVLVKQASHRILVATGDVLSFRFLTCELRRL